MDLNLLVLQGKPQGKEIPVRVSPFVIGRGPECQLRPNSDLVSRLHCKLVIDGESVRIRDLGSSNGTIVDGERLTQEMTLDDGDIFQVGPLVFQVVIRRTAAPDSATAPAAPVMMLPAAGKPDAVDEVVQWLISDTKGEVPASGSGVYGGKTAFMMGPPQSDAGAGAEVEQPPPETTTPQSKTIKPRTDQRAEEKKPHKPAPEATGAAAHAADDLIRRFLERRPHK
jgi:pSer/pThr/pTyr-binding forkhead associated (FHA) protein